MKILLIAPGKDVHYSRRLGLAFKFPPLNLATIAGLTKPGIDVSILDENVEKIDYNAGADIVGITVMTTVAPRAYRIADEFRKRGSKVVLGGAHVSAVPEEAIQHADSIVVGEAEGSWQRLIEDFEKGQLQKFYKNEERPSLIGLPDPRRDLYKKRTYFVKETIQTTRGCPFACSFCSVSNFFGKTYRSRPAEDIAKIIVKRKSKFVGFIDDNIAGNARYSKRLFEALIPLKIKWVGQASTTITKDPELLQLARKSGCVGLFVGFESIIPASIEAMTKAHNVKVDFKEVITKFHDQGIVVLGAFVFGSDNEDKSVFEQTLEFIDKSKLDLAQFTPLTPLPGTALHTKLTQENRIIETDWKKYDMQHALFNPKNMTLEELQDGCEWIWREFYSTPYIIRRMTNPNFNFSKTLLYSLPVLIINMGFKKALDFNRATNMALEKMNAKLQNSEQ